VTPRQVLNTPLFSTCLRCAAGISARPTVWTTSPRFNNLRFEGSSRFFFLNAAGAVVAFGHKSSFCMIDLFDMPEFDTVSAGVDCNCQGVSAGFADICNRGLECQSFDVTDVPAGNDTLLIETNTQASCPPRTSTTTPPS